MMCTDGDACRRENEYALRATQQNMTILKADDERRWLLLFAVYIFLLWAILTAVFLVLIAWIRCRRLLVCR